MPIANGQADKSRAEFRRAGGHGEAGRRQPPSCFRRGLAVCQDNLGAALDQMVTAAIEQSSTRKRWKIAGEAGRRPPRRHRIPRQQLGGHQRNLATVLSATGKVSEAEGEYRQAIAISRKLTADNPAVTLFRDYLAIHHHHLAILLWQTGKPTEAEAEYRRALEIDQKLAADNPAVTEFRHSLAGCHHDLAGVLWATGKVSEAEAEYRQTIRDLPESDCRQSAVPGSG